MRRPILALLALAISITALGLPGEDVTLEGPAFERVKRGEMVKAFIVSSEYRQEFGKP